MVIKDKVDIHLEDKRRSRLFFLFIWLMYSVVYMTRNCFSSAMAQIVATGIFTKSQTGLLSSVFYMVYAPLQIPGGMLADKYSPERFIKIGLVGSAVVNIVIFFTHNYYVMLTAWIFNAVIQAPIWPAVFKIISSQLVRSDRKQMIFLTSFTNSFGLALGYAVAAFIPSWEYNFLISVFVLLVCVIVLHILCKNLDPYMKPDKNEENKNNNAIKNDISTIKIFAASGFFLLLPGVLLRTMIEIGIKTFSPTMLMESYSNISASTGNLLNVLIIISGILGTLIVKFLLYPRFIKNEPFGMCLMMSLALPFAFILKMLGNIRVSYAVISLCVVSVVLTATSILLSYFTLYFVPYRKNGLASGISNSASSFGVVLESYGFMRIAENNSWNAVTMLWIIMLIIAVVFTAFAIPFSINFKKKTMSMENI